MSTETRDALDRIVRCYEHDRQDPNPDRPEKDEGDNWPFIGGRNWVHYAMDALRATDASEGEAWVPPTPADLDQLLIEWWPLQRDEYVAYIVGRATAPAEGLRGAATEALRVLESVADEHRRHLRQGDLIGAKWINLAADGLRTALATPEPDRPPCGLCGHTYTSHLLGVACCDCIGYATPEPDA